MRKSNGVKLVLQSSVALPGSAQALNICMVTSFPPDEALLKDATAWVGSPPKENSDGSMVFVLPDQRSVLGIVPPSGTSSLATFMSKTSGERP